MAEVVPQGVSVPPEELQRSIDKTVTYVAKNGDSFVARLKENNKDGKFDFLTEGNQYNEYYVWKLAQEGSIGENSGSVNGDSSTSNHTSSTSQISAEPPQPLPFLTSLPTISMLDLDIIKATALFVAKNGPQYLSKLVQHEKSLGNQAQFEFVNKLHSFNKLFLHYIEQYKLVFNIFTSKDDSAFKRGDNLLQKAQQRGLYNKQHKQKVQTKRKLDRERQLHFASIDWQDFSVIGTIEFDAVDAVQELPVPLTREDLLYRSLEAKQQELVVPVQKAVSTEPEAVDTPSPSPGPAAVKIKGMKIKAAGESRLKKSTISTNLIKCPITGQMIAEDKFDEHLKVLLRDPRYKQEQDNFMKKNFTYSSNLTTDQVYENIKRLVSKRSGGTLEQPSKRPQIGPQ